MAVRRWFLFLAAATLSACPTSPPLPAPLPPGQQPQGWDDAVRIAEAVDTDPDPTVVAVDFEAKVVPLEITPGVLTQVWTYNGQLPGPTLRANVGDRVVVTFTNSLPEPTTIHWHGLRVPADMDGTDMAQSPVQPQETFVYDFVVPDAGTYWYHPHVNSSAQIGFGLYGAVVISDPDEEQFGDDLVVVLSDIGLDGQGQLLPGDHQGWFGDYFGRQGSISLVNGRQLPSVQARVGVPQRWRLVNASRAKYARFGLADHGFTQVAVDGGLLELSIDNATLTLAAGARADVVFAARRRPVNNSIEIVDVGVDQFHIASLPPPLTLFTVNVTDDPPAGEPHINARLRVLPAFDATSAVEQRLELNEVLAADGNTYTGINGQLYDGADMMTARVESNEVWTLVNKTSRDHSFHLHGFFFELLDVDGAAPSPRGLFDTLNLEPEQVVRIGIHFDNRPGLWMLHCHIIDHADAGMMRMLMVE